MDRIDIRDLREVPIFTQHDLSLDSMCVAVALAMALKGSEVPFEGTTESLISKALELDLTHKELGGLSAAACVRLAEEYATPEFIAFGKDATKEQTQSKIREWLKRGSPLVVMTTVALNRNGTGHAMCLVAIDEENNVTLHDSFSFMKSRGIPENGEGLGTPRWELGPGSFVATWEEFDFSLGRAASSLPLKRLALHLMIRCWNTVDNYITVPDATWDTEGRIGPLYQEREWRRFCCAFFSK